jgi:8-oxo-dGTP pyrophosphatase MutT (NUDIX family)
MRSTVQAVVCYQDRILLLLRGLSAPWAPGQWGLPGGHIDPGEAPLDAMKRELWEETDITPPYTVRRIRAEPGRFLYVVLVATPFVQLLDGEHDDSAWVRLSQIQRFDLAPGVWEALCIAAAPLPQEVARA